MEKEPAVLPKIKSKKELSKICFEYKNKLSESDEKIIHKIFEENS